MLFCINFFYYGIVIKYLYNKILNKIFLFTFMSNVNKKNVEKKYKKNRIKRANKIKRANRIKATKIVPISNIDLEKGVIEKGVIEQNVNDDDNSSNLCCKCEFNRNYVLIVIFILIIFIILFSFVGPELACSTNCSLTN